jgi:predicted ATP-dependent Lon-type protease
MKLLISAAIFSAFALSPASAAMMACTGDNMMKSTTMMMSMPESPGKTAAYKEIGMANMDMSGGKMKSACMHYMKAQKAAMMK